MSETWIETPDDAPQCQKMIYVRDTYRYTGRGPGGFSLKHTHQRCSRRPADGSACCWQHEPGWATNLWRARIARKWGGK